MKNRRYFLKTACKPIVLAALGIPVIEACSSEDDSSVSTQTTSSSNNSSPQGGTSTELIIDLDDNTFSSLQETGGWLNFTSENILLVRISDSEIRVFDNACPTRAKSMVF